MAHPVRPPAYQEINNFYTATVYIKGAEVVRMYHTLLGEEGFQKGMRLYFQRHDGDAVTTDDFLAAMADANDLDLSHFRRWYDQAGTPTLHVSTDYDEVSRRFALTLRQSLPETAADTARQPMHIPVSMGLVDPDGQAVRLKLAGEETHRGDSTVLSLTESEQRFVFEDVDRRPVPSLLRGFSAPVKLDFDQSDADLAHLMAHDSDSFNRWEAGQRLGCRVIIAAQQAIRDGEEPVFPEAMEMAFEAVLKDSKADPGLRAEALTLPAETWLAELVDEVDPVAIAEAREALRVHLARRFPGEWRSLQAENDVAGPYRVEPRDILKRGLHNLAMDYRIAGDDEAAREGARTRFTTADNMTDQLAAMKSLVLHDDSAAEEILDRFYRQWQEQPLVVDKWFSLQAQRTDGDPVARIQELREHPAFNIRNPNKVRALYGAFANGNRRGFHVADGSGYRLLADVVLELDSLNPSIAARLVSTFNPWKRLEPVRREKMREQLERIDAAGELSRDVGEIVSRALS
jgi:aminopeptidase N